jgi:hypothetical protein
MANCGTMVVSHKANFFSKWLTAMMSVIQQEKTKTTMNREFIVKEGQMGFSPMKISLTSNLIMQNSVSLCGFNLHFYQKWKKKAVVHNSP